MIILFQKKHFFITSILKHQWMWLAVVWSLLKGYILLLYRLYIIRILYLNLLKISALHLINTALRCLLYIGQTCSPEVFLKHWF